jgi:hypothetical protein
MNKSSLKVFYLKEKNSGTTTINGERASWGMFRQEIKSSG